MAKKKSAPKSSSPKGKTPKPKRSSAADGLARLDLPPDLDPEDLAELMKVFASLMGAVPGEIAAPKTALGKKGKKKAASEFETLLGRADQARTRREKIRLLEEAVAAGDRELGPEFFEENTGHFWSIFETRPYMKARAELAHFLWEVGRRDESIAQFQELLRLNPNDNQGLRYRLTELLMAEDRTAELLALLKEYDDASGLWDWSKALLTFRLEGDTPKAASALKAALKSNKHVPAYLLGNAPFPPEAPMSYGFGDDNEAQLYAKGALPLWHMVPGAIAWLRAKTARPSKGKKSEAKSNPVGPTPEIKAELAKLPATKDVWQAVLKQIGPRMEHEGAMLLPWMFLVLNIKKEQIQKVEISAVPFVADHLWDSLAAGMRAPEGDVDPGRPASIEVRSSAHWDSLRPHLKELGISLKAKSSLEPGDFMAEDFKRRFADTLQQPPSLYDEFESEPSKLKGFFSAAAAYHRAAPWRRMGHEAAIEIECPALSKKPLYGIILGMGGESFGLGLYEDGAFARKLGSLGSAESGDVLKSSFVSLTYGPAADLSDEDLDLIERQALEVDGLEAYPATFQKGKGVRGKITSISIEQMARTEAALLALPAFVRERRQDDSRPFTTTVAASGGSVDLTLTWMLG